MKKLFALVLCIALCLTSAAALAAGRLSVTQENFHAVPSYTTYGYAYAKVENSGDKPIKINAGVLEIYDADGEVITSDDYLSAYAEYLQPGEYTYVSMYEEIEGAEDGVTAADYMLTLTGKSDKDGATLRLPVTTDLQLNVEEGWWVHNYLYATITNNTDEPMYDIGVVMALLDEDGNILYMDSDNLYNDRALMPGSSMIIRKDIPSSFIDYFAANSMTPASVDAVAYVNVDLD